jgi:glucokinase
MLLAGDVGGTTTRLGWFAVEGGRPVARAVAKYPSRDHAGAAEIVRRFVREHPHQAERAAFGVAGPVRAGRVETPNLPWVVTAPDLARALDGAAVDLLNDLEANTHGISVLNPDDVHTLAPGAPGAVGNLAVIAAGTGLGEAGAYWDGRRHHPFACEGGHGDFAPGDALDSELLAHLRARYGAHVSCERVVSGPGLVSLYEFLRDTGRGTEEPWLRDRLSRGDAAAVIGHAALQGESQLCVAALAHLARLYGAEAGNLALKVMATGGVYLGGGIAPRILPFLERHGFLDGFLAKGRMRPLLEAIPVRVILNEDTALLGAARHAASRAGLLGEEDL